MADAMEIEVPTGIFNHERRIEVQSNPILSLIDLPASDSDFFDPLSRQASPSPPPLSIIIPRYLQGWVGGRFYDPTVPPFSAVGAARFAITVRFREHLDNDSDEDSDEEPGMPPRDTVCPAKLDKASHTVRRVLGSRPAGSSGNTQTGTDDVHKKLSRKLKERRTKVKQRRLNGKPDERSRQFQLALRLLNKDKNPAEASVAIPPTKVQGLTKKPEGPLPSSGQTQFNFPQSLHQVPLAKLSIAKDSRECEWCMAYVRHGHITFGLLAGLRLPGLNLPSEEGKQASKICAPCCATRISIVNHSRHGPWLNYTTALLLIKPGDPSFRRMRERTCDVCTGIATAICQKCPLTVCVNCQVVLDGMCAGKLDELISALGRNNIKNDACLLFGKPIDKLPSREKGIASAKRVISVGPPKKNRNHVGSSSMVVGPKGGNVAGSHVQGLSIGSTNPMLA